MDILDFDELIDGEFDFYGVDGNCFRLDDTTYEFVDDGESCEIVEALQPLTGLPIARVIVEQVSHGVYELIDLHDDHKWLSFGVVSTDYAHNVFFDNYCNHSLIIV